MSYLITQTFILLLLAGLLGMTLGWYLTRIAAAGARAALQARLRSAETDAQELRAELDVAVNAKAACETDRRVLGDELNAMRARHGDAGADAGALQAELEACRSALEAAVAPAAVGEREVDSAAIVSAASAAAAGASGLIGAGAAPPGADPASGEADDLQQIKGIGPKIAGTLRDLGILRFEQIASWTPQNIEWVNEHLKFKGRIEREEWIPQARALIAARGRGA
jgi:predicted flap endonuclease-1-like 5' DNA nuclease